jgi:putative phosphonate metabolism protein
MAGFPRYAIYSAPASGTDLDRFGAGLLGYDAYSGCNLSFPEGMTPDWHGLTGDPRKYGFHATLKAPFSLAQGKTEVELIEACELFAGKARPIPVIKPVIDSISDFVALVPADRSPELERLAADCVSNFDAFRAPLTSKDRARRNPSALTPRQSQHLDRWGYPYVMQDYRFHMTLTGRLDDGRRDPVVTMLRDRFSATGLKTLAIDRIALFSQNDAVSRFRILRHYVLAPMHN